MRRWVVGLVCLWGSVSAFGTDVWQQLGDQIVKEHKQLRATWGEKQSWSGMLCNGFYEYKLDVGATLEKVQVELKEEGYFEVTARAGEVYAATEGMYRSKATLCAPAHGWLGLGSPWAELVTKIHFGEDGLNDLRVEIVSTKLGTLRLGRYVPKWFGDFAAGLLNRGMTYIWNSRIGGWLNGKITAEVRKRIPQSQP